MRKALLPMIASLALCGAATAALVATNARAEQSGRKPVMIALMTPNERADGSAAARPAEGGSPSDMRARMMRDMGVRREQVCKDLYAHEVGKLAFLEAKLSLTANQAPLFARWKQASLDIAKQREGDCAAGHQRRPEARGPGLSVVDRLALEENLLKKRLADIQAERPALTAFYNSLTPEQKEEFGHGDMHRMAGRMHMMLGMMDRPHPGMGPGRMGSGPMAEPLAPAQ
jgi:LTXXQ motif family protein